MSRAAKHRGSGAERERQRRARADVTASPGVVAVPISRRAAASSCGWCGSAIEPKPTGRIPKWCSASCPQRAWEQRRAAASGRAAVEVVERFVSVEVERARQPRHRDWAPLLRELASQLDTGRIYARDLVALAGALHELNLACHHHPATRHTTH